MKIQTQRIIQIFNGLNHKTPPLETLPLKSKQKRASILIPLIKREELTVLLTIRTAHLASHGGQISFPGGQWEDEDPTPAHTALRESQEEIGLCPKSVEIICELGSCPTISGYLISPFIGVIDSPIQFCACEDEVTEIFEIPLSYLMTPNLFKKDFKIYHGQKIYFHYFNYENKYIWGFTAGILHFLIEELFNSLKLD